MSAAAGAPIPLVDLAAQHRQVADEVETGFREVIDRTAFVLGPQVAAFEEAFAAFCGVGHCVGVANGTDALELALRALGVGVDPADEVIVPVNSFVASGLAVVRAGARPVFVDIDPVTYLCDVEAIAARISPRTKAVMPVHLYGQVAPMEAVAEVATAADVAVVEDAAQAQGARRHGRPAGSFGALAATSFYPGKNLGAYGDGGAVVTDDAAAATKVRALRNYGSEVKYLHPEVGFNSRLDTLQAVVLTAKLVHLERWNGQRRAAAGRYASLLADLDDQLALPVELDGNESIWHLYVVRLRESDAARRDEVLAQLHAAGIGAGIHYPVPMHLQGAFASLGHAPGDFPVAEEVAGQIISLPMFAEITSAQQERVVDVLRKALR